MTTIKAIARLNEETGHHFFSPSTMAFFDSIIEPYVYGGRYFVTSEKPPNGERVWTIREAHPDGNITDVGDFGQYKSPAEAHRAAARLVHVYSQRTRSTT